MGGRREPASSRGIDVRWSRPCNVEDPDRPMVAALIASVIAFQLNTTMLIPAIHTINEEFGLGAIATMSTYFSLAGAVSSVVHIR